MARSPTGPTPKAPARTLVARFETWDQLVERYDKELAHGGLFVPTKAPPQPFSKVKLRLFAPGDQASIVLSGEVVYVVQPDQAEENKQPGAGIQFSHTGPEEERSLKELLKLGRKRLIEQEGGRSQRARRSSAWPPIHADTRLKLATDPKKVLELLQEQLRWFKQKDPHTALGISRETDIKEARRVYFKLCKRYHPDLYVHFSDRDITEAVTNLFALIQAAYGTLEKTHSRRAKRTDRSAK